MKKLRFYVDTDENEDAYQVAMRFACEYSKDNPEIEMVVILIDTKRDTGWFEKKFGKNVVKQLFTGRKFENCNPIFKIETKKTFKNSLSLRPIKLVITCALDSEDVFPIDDFFTVKVIVAVPWLRDGLSKWIQTWNPTILGSGQQVGSKFPEPSCIVMKAMSNLTSSINMSTGIDHSSDEWKAKTFILSLHKYEKYFNADIVGSYLVRELNWKTKHAQKIEKLINTLNSGGHFKGGERTGLKSYYDKWKRECDEEDKKPLIANTTSLSV